MNIDGSYGSGPAELALPDLKAITRSCRVIFSDVELATLTPREEQVMRLYYGIGCEPKTLVEISGQVISVTCRRLHQILKRAEAKLADPIRRARMAKFMGKA